MSPSFPTKTLHYFTWIFQALIDECKPQDSTKHISKLNTTTRKGRVLCRIRKFEGKHKSLVVGCGKCNLQPVIMAAKCAYVRILSNNRELSLNDTLDVALSFKSCRLQSEGLL